MFEIWHSDTCIFKSDIENGGYAPEMLKLILDSGYTLSGLKKSKVLVKNQIKSGAFLHANDNVEQLTL